MLRCTKIKWLQNLILVTVKMSVNMIKIIDRNIGTQIILVWKSLIKNQAAQIVLYPVLKLSDGSCFQNLMYFPFFFHSRSNGGEVQTELWWSSSYLSMCCVPGSEKSTDQWEETWKTCFGLRGKQRIMRRGTQHSNLRGAIYVNDIRLVYRRGRGSRKTGHGSFDGRLPQTPMTSFWTLV